MEQQEESPQALTRILVVDDSEYNRKIISKTLEKHGFTIVGEAASGKEATESLSSTQANLIIIDVVMPDVSGIELARVLKENFSDLYVIMISSLDQEHIVWESLAAGAIDFLKQPVSENDLIESVRKISLQIQEDLAL